MHIKAIPLLVYWCYFPQKGIELPFKRCFNVSKRLTRQGPHKTPKRKQSRALSVHTVDEETVIDDIEHAPLSIKEGL